MILRSRDFNELNQRKTVSSKKKSCFQNKYLQFPCYFLPNKLQNKKRKLDQRNLDQSLLSCDSLKVFSFFVNIVIFAASFIRYLLTRLSRYRRASYIFACCWLALIGNQSKKWDWYFLVIWQRKIHSFMALNGWLF